MAHANGNGSPPEWQHAFGAAPRDPQTTRGAWVVLADGQKWLVPPLTFYDRIVHEEDVVLPAFESVDFLTKVETCEKFGRLLHLVMQRNYPGLPLELAYSLIDYETLPELVPLLLMQNGVHFRELLRKMGLSPPETSSDPSTTAPTGPSPTSPSGATSAGPPP